MIRRAPLMLLAAVCLPALAQNIYSWRDASGHVHYSDTPPPAGKMREIRPAPQPSVEAKPPVKAAAVRDAEKGKQPAGTEAAKEAAEKEKAAQAELRQRDCAEARAQLAGLDGGLRASRVKQNGEREYLDDTQRKAETDRTRSYIEKYCGQ